MIKIGLFPLNIVLFPESLYPLHIFEDKYKKLITECYKNKLEFGISYFDKSGINHTGCTAIVKDVLKIYPDEKLDIIIQGISRYRIIRINEGENPYLTAEIEPFADDDFGYEPKLFEEVASLFNKIVDGISSIKIDKISTNEIRTKYPSFLIAQKAGLSPLQKQSLIEIRSENLRLETIAKHLRKVQPLIKQAEVISNIVKNDGYIKPSNVK